MLRFSPTAVAWLPFAAASAHIFEEFVFPGGFSAWYRRYRPDAAASFTPGFAVTVNALLLAACLAIPLGGLDGRGAALWLTIAALLAGNAVFHIRATFLGGEYSPGVVTASLLYLPMAAAGYFHFIRSGGASWGTALGAALLGGSYNLLSARLHRRRARALGSRGD